MCGIVGIVGTSAVNQRIYDALTVLQHRGQDAAGIATSDRRRAVHAQGQRAGARCLPAASHARAEGQLSASATCAIRRPVATRASEAQPFYVNAPYGICLAHNGNLTNATELAEILIREDRRHLNTTSDSEVLLNVFASELQRIGTPRVTPADMFAALNAVYRRCRGGYAVVAMIIGHGILGFRDPNGIRPLVLGQRDTPRGPEWMLASESVALDMLSFKFVRDIGPGEAVFIDEQGRLHSQQLRADRAAHALHLRVRVLRAARLEDRQHLGVSRAHAHGRPARRQDPARASRITTSTSSSRFPTRAAPARCSSRSGSA